MLLRGVLCGASADGLTLTAFQVTKMCIFGTYYTKSARLDELEQTQVRGVRVRDQ